MKRYFYFRTNDTSGRIYCSSEIFHLIKETFEFSTMGEVECLPFIVGKYIEVGDLLTIIDNPKCPYKLIGISESCYVGATTSTTYYSYHVLLKNASIGTLENNNCN